MKLYGIGAALAVTLSAALSAQTPVVPQAAGQAAERQIVLTGCVVKADNGYVLADATEETSTEGPRAAPDPFRGRTLYWLDDDDDLKDYKDQRVMVTGKVASKLEKGEIEVNPKDEGTELEFKANGKKVSVMVPNAQVAVGTAGTTANKDNDFSIVVLNVDVKSVKKIADSCK